MAMTHRSDGDRWQVRGSAFSEGTGMRQSLRWSRWCAVAVFLSLPTDSFLMAEDSMNARAQKFVDAHVAKLKPLEKEAGIAWWDANTSGKDEDFQRKEIAQNKIDAALADPVAFRELKSIKE